MSLDTGYYKDEPAPKPKKRKPIRVEGFAVLGARSGKLVAFGNGKQFQLPIFDKEKEARGWRDEDRDERGRIVEVVIKERKKK